MYTVSDAFLTAIRYSVKRRTVVDVYYGSTTVPIITDIPVEDGTLTYDRASDARCSGSITVASENFNFDILEPSGTEISVRSGVVFGNGEEELVPMGRFRIQDLDRDDGDYTRATISFIDRTIVLQDILTMYPLFDFSQRDYGQMISYLVSNGFTFAPTDPTVIIDSSFNVSRSIPGGSSAEGSYWQALTTLVQGLGGEHYFDRNGDYIVGVVPSITEETVSGDAVWIVNAGEPDGVLVSASRKRSRAGTYNRVQVWGAANSNNKQVFGQWSDDNPLSPTYYKGPFGLKILKVTNDTLVTVAQCENSARELLKNYTGLAHNISFTALQNPALDVGDIIEVVYLDGSTELHLVESLSFQFNSGEMSGETRTIQFSVGSL